MNQREHTEIMRRERAYNEHLLLLQAFTRIKELEARVEALEALSSKSNDDQPEANR